MEEILVRCDAYLGADDVMFIGSFDSQNLVKNIGYKLKLR